MKKYLIFCVTAFLFIMSSCTAGYVNKRVNNMDLSFYFNNISGCAVFYNASDKQYDVYNKSLAEQRISPYSTFKIIMTLMLLNQNILNLTSTIGYDGTVYEIPSWNADLTLEEAFKASCVWYYKKAVNSLNKNYAESVLKNLNFGNCNISAWKGQDHNAFWLGSTLEISPTEYIAVLENIFDKDNMFSQESVNLLKDIMLTVKNDKYAVYGKTGSGKTKDGWFVGFFEMNNKKYYFAVYLETESGLKAKEILLEIVDKHYGVK